MAELTVFAYRHADSWLHRLDIRIKLVAIICLSATVLALANPWALLLVLVVLIAVHARTGTALQSLGGALLRFAPFLGFVFMARWLSTPGRPFFDIDTAPLTIEGLYAGTTAGLRLATLVVLSMLLTRTTLPGRFSAAIAWLGRPIPGLPEKKLALMLGLVLRLLPLILQQLKETAEAQRARGIGNRRNPFFRLTCPAVTAMRQIFRRTDHLADAMLARGYTDARGWPMPRLALHDLSKLIWIGLFCFLLSWIDTVCPLS